MLILFIFSTAWQKTSGDFIEERMQERCGFASKDLRWSVYAVDHYRLNRPNFDTHVLVRSLPFYKNLKDDYGACSGSQMKEKIVVHLTIRPQNVINIQNFDGTRIPILLNFKEVR